MDIPISKFKADCSKLIEQVRRTCKPLCLTRYGVPVVEIVPVAQKRKFIGDMIGTAEIVGDIVSPVIALDEIEAYRDWNSTVLDGQD